MIRKAAVLACAAALAAGAASAQDWTKSKWGPDDQAGASNLMTPDKAKQAAALIKTGSVLSIGRTYEATMPLFGSRVVQRALEMQPAAHSFFVTDLPGPWETAELGRPDRPVFRKPFVVRDVRTAFKHAFTR